VCHYLINSVAEQPMYLNFAILCLLCEGKVGAKTIYISLVFMNYRNLNQHAAEILFGLTATLTSVSGGCDVVNKNVKVFDISRLGIGVLI